MIEATLLEKLALEADRDEVEQLVVGAVVRHGGKILLLQRPADDFMGGIWELPSGKVETGEAIDQAVIREVEEETGLDVTAITGYLGEFDYRSGSGKKSRQFNFTVDVGRAEPVELTEHDAYAWTSLVEEPPVTDAVKQVLVRYVDQQTKPQRHKVIGDVHLVLRRGDHVLYGRRQDTGYEDGAWHLPSGHLEAGESVVAALIREADEEIGITIRPEDVHFSHIMHNSSSGGRVAFFFTVTNWQGDPTNREPEKCGDLGWFGLDAPPDRMIDYCREAMQHIRAQRMFSTFGW